MYWSFPYLCRPLTYRVRKFWRWGCCWTIFDVWSSFLESRWRKWIRVWGWFSGIFYCPTLSKKMNLIFQSNTSRSGLSNFPLSMNSTMFPDLLISDNLYWIVHNDFLIFKRPQEQWQQTWTLICLFRSWICFPAKINALLWNGLLSVQGNCLVHREI